MALAVVLFAVRMLIQTPETAWVAGIPRPILHVPEFFIGVLLAAAMRQGWRPRSHPAVPALGIAAWIGIIVLFTAVSPGTRAIIYPYAPEVITVLCAWLIASTASTELRGGARLMLWRPFVALGEWSFAFYLIHATILYAVLERIGFEQGSGLRLVTWVATVLAAGVLAAWLLHAFVEKPVEKRLRGWQQQRRSRLARVSPV